MTQETDTFPDEEFPLRHYLSVLLRKWWVVAFVVAVTVASAMIFSLFQQVPEIYGTQTKLLVVAPVSERLVAEQIGGSPLQGANFSVETLSTLATASDLLQTIIVELDLRELDTGLPLVYERLAGMMTATVATGPKSFLPLLLMDVRGEDPKLITQVADKWAQVFIQNNSELFLNQVQTKRAALVEAQAQLESAEEALAAEPEFLTLERVVSNDVIWTFLASNPDGDAVEALLDLTVEEQVRNDLYVLAEGADRLSAVQGRYLACPNHLS